MTRADLMTLALAITNTTSRPVYTVSSDQNKLANRMMVSYAEITHCLYDDRVPFTLGIGTAIYDLRNVATTPFTKRFAEVRQITVNGTLLVDPRLGEPGPVTLPYLEQIVDPAYQVAANGPPSLWMRLGRTAIRLYTPPDQVYANSFASGYTLPADIDTSAGGDSAVIEIPDEHFNDLATWVAFGLMFPNNAGDSDFARFAQLQQGVAARMMEMARQSQMVAPMRYRGANKDRPTRLLF